MAIMTRSIWWFKSSKTVPALSTKRVHFYRWRCSGIMFLQKRRVGEKADGFGGVKDLWQLLSYHVTNLFFLPKTWNCLSLYPTSLKCKHTWAKTTLISGWHPSNIIKEKVVSHSPILDLISHNLFWGHSGICWNTVETDLAYPHRHRPHNRGLRRTSLSIYMMLQSFWSSSCVDWRSFGQTTPPIGKGWWSKLLIIRTLDLRFHNIPHFWGYKYSSEVI